MPPVPSRKSKLDPYLDLLGTMSDRELAELAGTSPENVRAYRLRRGIPASWRGEEGGASREPEHLTERESRSSQKVRLTSDSEAGLRGRKSKLATFESELGKVPDRELAEKAGVTVQNVRAYRVRRGIPSWRDASRGLSQPLASNDSTKPRGRPRKVSKPSSPQSSVEVAFRVVIERMGERQTFVVVAPGFSEAARRAESQLKKRWKGGLVVELTRLAPVL